jgi:hypothetical protein
MVKSVKKVDTLLNSCFIVNGPVTIRPDLVVDVHGDVMLRGGQAIEKFPVQFGLVSGNFWCEHNQLTSLQGAPDHVGGNFSCEDNKLTSLQGAPGHVGLNFECNSNKLTSLQGAPAHVVRDFRCSNNRLTDLQGAPAHVGRDFLCDRNKLVSLTGAPAHVGDVFVCTYGTQLPLLRLTMYTHMNVMNAPTPIIEILDKYVGKGKPGALKAAAELIKAGYQDNARW